MLAEDRVAVMPLFQLDAGMEMATHIQVCSDHFSLIGETRALQSEVELLKGDDIRIKFGDDGGGPLGQRFAVFPDTTMDVIGHDRKFY